MPYCYKCGNKLAPDSSFCPKCGTPVKQEIKRCPDCGESVPFYERECPACGHVFVAEMNSSAQAQNSRRPYKETKTGTAASRPEFDLSAVGKGFADAATAAGKTIASAASAAGKSISEGAASMSKSAANPAKPKGGSVLAASQNPDTASRMRRCPNCGEVIDSFVTVCPACGCELHGDASDGSVRDFTQKLEAISAMATQKASGLAGLVGKNAYSAEDVVRRKIDLIKDYPIPNTREDIYEFMILASSNYEVGDNSELGSAWEAKFEQAYQKARVAFGNSADFDRIQSIYDTNERQRAGKKKAKTLKILTAVMVAAVGVVMMIVGEFAGSASGDENSPFYMLCVLGMFALFAVVCFMLNHMGEG